MLVEDDPDILAIAQLALESLGGFTVSLCHNGNTALERAEAFQPDLILMDVMMPELDGPSTLAALRDLPNTAETPVVFMTARAQKHEVEEYRRLGAVDVIRKPFDPIQLPQSLRSIWRTAA
ncbi:MAG: response regulator [Rhodothermales bacterium]